MNRLVAALDRVRRRLDVLSGYGRAQLARARGARMGRRVRMGSRGRIDRPWTVDIGDRCEIEADVWIKVVTDEARVEVGARTFLGRGTELDVSARLTIGERVLVAPRVFITDHSHRLEGRGPIDMQGCTTGPVVIADDAWLGTACVILPGVRIGRGAVVGAGAVVTRDVPDLAIVAGVPARLLRYRE